METIVLSMQDSCLETGSTDIGLGGRSEFSALYLLETNGDLERVAETIAGEQSCGTFTRLPFETKELRARARARVVSLTVLDGSNEPTYRSAFLERRDQRSPARRAHLEIAFPTENVGPNLPTLLATVAGNLFELGEVTGVKLLDIDLPPHFAAGFTGPGYGVTGTRRLVGVPSGPLIGTIIKPSVGLSVEDTAAIVDTLCEAGVDFIKDDELLANPPHSPLAERICAVMAVIEKHADRLGRKVMFAFNVSGSVDHMRRSHDLVLKNGGTCTMVSLNWVGHAGVEDLRRHSELPIHGHRNGWGMFTRSDVLGMAYTAYQKIWRLAGVDHMHVNGIDSKFWEPNDSVIASANACLAPFAGLSPVMPVFSSGQWGGQAPATYRALQSTDLMYLAGGGIFAHPDGLATGVKALREAWDAAAAGVELDRYAESHPALANALRAFRPRDSKGASA
jgi:ribulose-bisphosphate carboxylase large chain